MPKKAANIKLMKILLLALGVLIAALVVMLILLLAQGGANNEKQDAFVEESTYLNGISIAGIDISGQTYVQAAANAELQELARQVEDVFSYSLTVNGVAYTFSAAELGITSNLEPLLKEAMLYGQYGSQAGAQKRELNENDGKNFELAPYGDHDTVMAKINALKASTLDVMPQNATLNVSDDVKYDMNAEYLYQMEGVEIVEEVVGVDVDADGLATLICINLDNANYASIEVPAILTYPKVGVEALKANTKLISGKPGVINETTTTSFKTSSDDRITNVNIMASIVNGMVIQPGETWSINASAGPRNEKTAQTMGWAKEHGITNGRYEDQYGGGVCQVSGTLYNAAIRAELEITERHTHSWPSTYLPEGLDATINYPSGELDSAGNKDLKLTNPFEMPVYLLAYVDSDAKELTIAVYGPASLHGYEVDFVTIKVGSDLAPSTIYNYDAATLPDGSAITSGNKKSWVDSRDGQTWQAWKIYKDADGNVVYSEYFHEDSYRAFQGIYYCNYPNPLYVDDTATAG